MICCISLVCEWWLVLKNTKRFVLFLCCVLCNILTPVGCGGGGRVAPVTPDAGLPGAIDAHWAASHLDEINGPVPKAGETTGRLVTNIIHHLGEETEWMSCRKHSSPLSIIIIRLIKEIVKRWRDAVKHLRFRPSLLLNSFLYDWHLLSSESK